MIMFPPVLGTEKFWIKPTTICPGVLLGGGGVGAGGVGINAAGCGDTAEGAGCCELAGLLLHPSARGAENANSILSFLMRRIEPPVSGFKDSV